MEAERNVKVVGEDVAVL